MDPIEEFQTIIAAAEASLAKLQAECDALPPGLQQDCALRTILRFRYRILTLKAQLEVNQIAAIMTRLSDPPPQQ